MKPLLLLLLCAISGIAGYRQSPDRRGFSRIDRMAVAVGPMQQHPLGEIVHALKDSCKNETEMLRALYIWTAAFIYADNTMVNSRPKNLNPTPSVILRDRLEEPGELEL